MTREEMERLTAGTDNKSEKIRTLYQAGVARAEIGRFLDISYQHVQNVLKRSGLLDRAEPVDERAADEQVYTVTVGAGGKITLPPEYVRRCGIREGELLICREEDGGLSIMSRSAAVELLREIARKRMPQEAALLEALLGQPSSTG